MPLSGMSPKHRFFAFDPNSSRWLERPSKKFLERLAALYHNGYLDRPRAQLAITPPLAAPHLSMRWENKGAAILAELDGSQPVKKSIWTWKNRDARAVFLLNTRY